MSENRGEMNIKISGLICLFYFENELHDKKNPGFRHKNITMLQPARYVQSDQGIIMQFALQFVPKLNPLTIWANCVYRHTNPLGGLGMHS